MNKNILVWAEDEYQSGLHAILLANQYRESVASVTSGVNPLREPPSLPLAVLIRCLKRIRQWHRKQPTALQK